MKNRIASFEFVRMIACFLVILLHVSKSTNYLLRAFLHCGVPLFLIITGYFLFNNDYRDYLKLIKRTLIKVILPTIIIIFLVITFKSWINYKNSIVYCISNININNYIDAIKNILLINFSFESIFNYLWFVSDYFKIILLFPLLKLICQNKKTNNTIRRTILILALLITALNDCLKLFYNISIDYTFISFFPFGTILYVIIGYEFSLNKDKLFNKSFKNITIGFLIYFISCIIRFLLQDKLINTVGNNEYFIHSYVLIAYLIASSLFISLNNIGMYIKNEKMLISISKNCFYIYLLHWIILTILRKRNIYNKYYDMFCSNGNFINILIFTFIYSLIVFIICLLISCICNTSKEFIKALYYKIRRRIANEK